MRLFMGKRSNPARATEGEEILRSQYAGEAAAGCTAALPEAAFVVEVSRPTPAKPVIVRSSWIRRIDRAIERSFGHFRRTQYSEGYWWDELESNTTITSQLVMLRRLLGISDPVKDRSIVRYLLKQQNQNGSWGIYFGDGGEISTTIEAYFALKLLGQDPRSRPLVMAREFVLSRGGIEAARVFTKIWIALFGQYDWDKVPSMPVELVLLPPHFYFSVYEFSSWARGTAVPLSIVLSIRPKLDLPDQLGIAELYSPDFGHKKFASPVHKLFYCFDRMAKKFEQNPVRSVRQKAIEAARDWIIDHQEESGDWGGIQPPMVYSLLALHYLGYPLNHEVMVKGLKALDGFCLEDEDGLRMQSCVSPVWDTALTAMALLDAGISPQEPCLEEAAKWLIAQQVKTGGDWQFKNCCRPGGWAFEFCNSRYPDVDDSAVVLNVLNRFSPKMCEGLDCAKSIGLDWCISMQSSDGGWAAFDRDNSMDILNRIPFADTEAMVDPPTADVTGRVLEVMGCYGYDSANEAAAAGIRFLKQVQEKDGCWWGRWGVNYVYGTWSVLRGLISIGEDPRSHCILRAANWLKEHQNEDGGWGETCESYRRPELRGQGPSTPSQTAWAIMGLLAAGEERSPEASRGIQYLLRTQKKDGTWDEAHFTGTGFPKHFFIRYHNYRNCFPLMALGQYLSKLK